MAEEHSQLPAVSGVVVSVCGTVFLVTGMCLEWLCCPGILLEVCVCLESVWLEYFRNSCLLGMFLKQMSVKNLPGLDVCLECVSK